MKGMEFHFLELSKLRRRRVGPRTELKKLLNYLSNSSPVVADAGMLSASNLSALDEAHLRFIVGARATRAPGDLEAHFHWRGDALADGELIDTITPRRGSKTERVEV